MVVERSDSLAGFDDLGEMFSEDNMEETIDTLMENLGLDELVSSIKSMFQDIEPIISDFFAGLGIDNPLADDDEEDEELSQDDNQDSASRMPETLVCNRISESGDRRAGIMSSQINAHSKLIGKVLDLPGNVKDSPTAVVMPKNFDPSKRTKFVFQFHGLNSQRPDHRNSRLDRSLSAVESAEENIVYVYPLNKDQDEYYKDWMKGGDAGDFDTMFDSTMTFLADNGIQPTDYEVVARGHSAGGEAISNLGTTTSKVDQFEYADATYGGWASRAHQGIITNNPNARILIAYRNGHDTEVDANRMQNRQGVTLIALDGVDGRQDYNHAEAIDFFAHHNTLDDPEVQARIVS